MVKWQPIETAPKDGQLVLLGAKDRVRTGYWSVIDDMWHDHARTYNPDRSWRLGFEPTDWMPFPSAPDSGATP